MAGKGGKRRPRLVSREREAENWERTFGAKPPNPGSDAALDAGCGCPVLDNAHGRGHLGDGELYGWIFSGTCPLHGVRTETKDRGAK